MAYPVRNTLETILETNTSFFSSILAKIINLAPITWILHFSMGNAPFLPEYLFKYSCYTSQQHTSAKQQRLCHGDPTASPAYLFLGTHIKLSEITDMKHYIQLLIEANIHWRWHTWMPKLERPLKRLLKLQLERCPEREPVKNRQSNRACWAWDQWGNQINCYDASVSEASLGILTEIFHLMWHSLVISKEHSLDC